MLIAVRQLGANLEMLRTEVLERKVAILERKAAMPEQKCPAFEREANMLRQIINGRPLEASTLGSACTLA